MSMALPSLKDFQVSPTSCVEGAALNGDTVAPREWATASLRKDVCPWCLNFWVCNVKGVLTMNAAKCNGRAAFALVLRVSKAAFAQGRQPGQPTPSRAARAAKCVEICVGKSN